MWENLLCENDIYQNVEYVKTLYELQKEKVKKEQYIEGVLLDDYVKTVRYIPNKYEYVDEYFEKAQSEISNTKKSERKNVDLVTQWIANDFLNGEKVKLKNIMSGGYENYSWSIYFNLCGEEIEIVIPMRKHITAKNLHYAHYGKFVVFIKETSCSWSALFQSYKIEEVAEFFKKWTKEKKNDN